MVRLLRAAVSADLELRGETPDLTEDEILAWADSFHAAHRPVARAGIGTNSRIAR